MTRNAISPRLAMSTFLNNVMAPPCGASHLRSESRVPGKVEPRERRTPARDPCVHRHRDQDCESDSNDDQLLSLVPATPCTRSANSLGLVAKKTALSYEMVPCV